MNGRLLLVGDSHLARLGADALVRLQMIGRSAEVRAVAGATAEDALAQVVGLVLDGSDAVVVSIGTNDLAPWKQVPLPRFIAAADALLARLTACGRVAVLLPPVPDEDLQRTSRPEAVRSSDDAAPYRRAITLLAAQHHAVVIDVTGDVLHIEDGVHLGVGGETKLVEGIVSAVGSEPSRPGTSRDPGQE